MQTIGELFLQNGKPLLKMWNIDVPAGARPFLRHSHSRFEITVVNRGEGLYTTEQAVYPMRAGDVFVFSSNEIHCITQCGEEGLNITNLHFEPRYLGDEPFGDQFTDFCFSHTPEFQNRIPAEKATAIRLNHQQIQKELLSGKDLHPLAVRSYLNLMLIDLLRHHHYGKKPAGAFNMLQVYDYIEQHLCEELTLDALAETVHLSPNYFSHLFKQLNGISLWDYITTKRIEKAIRLLRDRKERRTILDIALQCGFNNTVHFNKAFKKQTGLTPSQLRSQPKLFIH